MTLLALALVRGIGDGDVVRSEAAAPARETAGPPLPDLTESIILDPAPLMAPGCAPPKSASMEEIPSRYYPA